MDDLEGSAIITCTFVTAIPLHATTLDWRVGEHSKIKSENGEWVNIHTT